MLHRVKSIHFLYFAISKHDLGAYLVWYSGDIETRVLSQVSSGWNKYISTTKNLEVEVLTASLLFFANFALFYAYHSNRSC